MLESQIHQLLSRSGQDLKKWSATKKKISTYEITLKPEKLLQLQEMEDHTVQGEIKQL